METNDQMPDELATLPVAELEAHLMEVWARCACPPGIDIEAAIATCTGPRYLMRIKCPVRVSADFGAGDPNFPDAQGERPLQDHGDCKWCSQRGYVFRHPDNGYGEVVRELGFNWTAGSNRLLGDWVVLSDDVNAIAHVASHEGLTGDRAMMVVILRAKEALHAQSD